MMLTWRVCYRCHQFRRWYHLMHLMQLMPHLQLLTAPPHRPTPLLEAGGHLLAIVGKATPHFGGRAARIFFSFCPDGAALTRQRDVSSTYCYCTRRNPMLELHRSAAGARQLPSLRGVGLRTAVSYSCLLPVLTSFRAALFLEPSGTNKGRGDLTFHHPRVL